MKSSPAAKFLFAAMLMPASIPFADARCSLQMLAPKDSKFTVDSMTIHFGEADRADQPSAWQGPLQAGACTFDIGIIEQPIAVTTGQLLYVTTYSGSQRTITLLDLQTCSKRWQSAPFAGKVTLKPDVLQMGAHKVALDESCVPAAVKRRK